MCTPPMYTSESPRRCEPGPWEPRRWDCVAAFAWIRRVTPRVTAKVTRNPISIHTAGARPVSTKMRWYHPTPEPYPRGLPRYRTARPGSAPTQPGPLLVFGALSRASWVLQPVSRLCDRLHTGDEQIDTELIVQVRVVARRHRDGRLDQARIAVGWQQGQPQPVAPLHLGAVRLGHPRLEAGFAHDQHQPGEQGVTGDRRRARRVEARSAQHLESGLRGHQRGLAVQLVAREQQRGRGWVLAQHPHERLKQAA